MRLRPEFLVAWFLCCFVATAVGQNDQLSRDDFRYDGKPFSFWSKYLQTELKAENRIDAVRAMAAFGVRGYGKEAAEVLVKLIPEYPLIRQLPTRESQDPNEKVLAEIWIALYDLGEPASMALFSQLGNDKVLAICYANYYAQSKISPLSMPITPEVIPSLIQSSRSHREHEQEMALRLLDSGVSRNQACAKQFRKEILNLDSQKYLKELLNLTSKYNLAWSELFACFGANGKAAIPFLVERSASKALKEIEATPEEIAYELGKLISRCDYFSEERAERLAKMGDVGEKQIPRILSALNPVKGKTLDSEDLQVRFSILRQFEPFQSFKKQRAKIYLNLLEHANSTSKFFQYKNLLTESYSFTSDEKWAITVETYADLISVFGSYSEIPNSPAILRHLSPETIALNKEIHEIIQRQSPDKAKVLIPAMIQSCEKMAKSNFLMPLIPPIAMTFAKMGPHAKEALPLLRDLQKLDDVAVQAAASEAIAAIIDEAVSKDSGLSVNGKLQLLVELSQKPDVIHSDNHEFFISVDGLSMYLATNNVFLRRVIPVIEKVGPKAKILLPRLIRSCENLAISKTMATRTIPIVHTIAKMGPHAKEALPLLRDLQKLDDVAVQAAASDAIAAISELKKQEERSLKDR